MKPADKPQCIFIQTHTKCNARCLMCPIVETQQKFPSVKMSDELYEKIIKELAHINYSREIGLYSQMEPLMDKTLYEKIDYAKETCPNAALVISTNASLLSGERADKLLNSKIDWIVFNVNGMTKDVYEKSMGLRYEQTFKNIEDFVELAKERGRFHPTHITNFRKWWDKAINKKYGTLYISANFVKHNLNKDEVELAKKFWHKLNILVHTEYWAGNRAGTVNGYEDLVPDEVNTDAGDNTRFKGASDVFCSEPFNHMTILSNGEVILCCNDWGREAVVGNLNHQTIMEVWHGERLNKIRESLVTRKGLRLLCVKCKR